MHRHTRSLLIPFLIFAVCGCNDSSTTNQTPISPNIDAATSPSITDMFASTEDMLQDSTMPLPEPDASMQEPRASGLIRRIQNGEIAEGTSVTLTNVVVTARLGGKGFFVSDGSTQPFSGLYVYHPNASRLTIAPGDIVNLVGLVKSYFGGKQVAMNADAIVPVSGISELPSPVLLSMDELCNPEEITPWEGMLISVENLTVDTLPVDGGFMVSGVEGECVFPIRPGISSIELGQFFSGQSISRMTGILHFEDNERFILPRSNEDIITVPLATGLTTIRAIRAGDVPLQSRIRLEGVVVTARDDYFVYVSSTMGGPRSGFRITDRERPVTVEVGDLIDVDLIVLTTTTGRSSQIRVAGTADLRPVTIQPGELAEEAFLYSLVSLSTVTVTQPNPTVEFIEMNGETFVFGDQSALFLTDGVTISRRFIEPSFRFLRNGDEFDHVAGLVIKHNFQTLRDGVSTNEEVLALAPRLLGDFVNYQPRCDSERCVGDLEAGDIIISEIFYGGRCEWIEIFNPGTEDIDLTHVTIQDPDSSRPGSRPFSFGDGILPAGRYAVVGCLPECLEGDAPLFFESDLGSALANDQDTIELRAGDLVLDRVEYVARRTNGMQLDPGTLSGHPGNEIMTTNDDPIYWCDATVTENCGISGTPGRENLCGISCLPDRCGRDIQEGDLQITEMMVDPASGISACEWIELHNATTQNIHLRGLLLVDGADRDLERSPNLLNGMIEPGGYGVITRDADACESSCMPTSLTSWKQHASLNNSGGDTLTLGYQGRIIDGVSYSLDSMDGVSMVRQSFSLNTPQNWCSSQSISPYCADENATPNESGGCQ